MTDSTTSASASSGRNWVPTVPGPLQRLFDAVPLVTYGPNELPLRSPGASELPTLHVFITEHDAARGAPSYNPSCLKWQVSLQLPGLLVSLLFAMTSYPGALRAGHSDPCFVLSSHHLLA